ncbi:DUF2782 domain-containing protein [Marinicella litoralis]|uniref:Uncharacterized protein DUF2782 n=1 Tax=Marinicella litoralis TaxID=644220 RepID=A0A4R6XSZ7_9GAMM|nr:DUF2782 domain-containing protein [Marinicella litoralis]TDR20543.1 uncharacterized protein DUF2782 [Marinicella litoralis]
MKCKLTFGLGLFSLPMLLTAQTNNNGNENASVIDERKPELLGQMTQSADESTSIRVIVQKKQTIEEYRQRGELVLVKVIPVDGVPYFIDPLERENLQGSSRDLINSGVKPVRWVLKEF